MTIQLVKKGGNVTSGQSHAWLLDPLEADNVSDEVFNIGRRALIRIALVASEAGARFQREGISQAPMNWMLSPSEMFFGQPPIEACMTLDGCARAVIVHGLGFDLDASAEAIDALMNSDEDIQAAIIANCASAMDYPLNAKKQPTTSALG